MYDMENMDPDYTDNRTFKEKLKDLGSGCLTVCGVIFVLTILYGLIDKGIDTIKYRKTTKQEQTNSIDTLKNAMDTIKTKNYSAIQKQTQKIN